MASRNVEIKVDIISDPTGSAKTKRIIGDLEKDVIASQKRVQQGSKATDRAIAESQKQTVNAAKLGAKSQADSLIRELKRMEGETKKSANSMQGYLKTAFGGGLIGGAVGGFAGSIVASFASQISQLPSLFKTQLDEMVRIATERQNAFKGLESMAKFLGLGAQETQDAVRNLRLVKAGVIDIGDATIGLKNLLSSGFSLPEATRLMEAFSDTAAFGKSAALTFGEAMRGATEGIRNGNSVLVDNVGLTKNLTAILKDAGFAEQDLGRVKDDANVRQALYNGLLKEALPQMGDANELTKGWTGNTSALTQAQNNLYAAIGDVIIRNKELNALVKTLTGDMDDLTKQVKSTESGWSQAINSMTSSFAKFVLDVRIGVNQEIADLKELVRFAELAANAIAHAFWVSMNPGGAFADWVGGKFGMAPQNPFASAVSSTYNRTDQLNIGLGSDSRAAASEASRLRSAFHGQVATGMGVPPGYYNPLFQAPPRLQRGTINLSSSNPLYFGPSTTTGPGTFAGGGAPGTRGGSGGGRGRALPRTKSSKVNLNLKDEMSDALSIAAKYGLLVTSGKDGKHNAGSAHYAGGAFDIRSIGVHPGLLDAAIRELQDAGYAVKDERSRPPGQKVWSAPHVHVGGRKTPKNMTANTRAIAAAIKDWEPDVFSNAQVSDEFIDTREAEIEKNRKIADLYLEMADALFLLNERTKEEIFLRDVKLGKYPELNEAQVEEIANTYKLIKVTEDKKKTDEEAMEASKKALEEYQQAQERLFQDTQYFFEDKLQSLMDGGFKGLWRSILDDMKRNFVKQFSTLLAQAFTPNFTGTQGGGGIFGGLFKKLFGGLFGGMGPGGTPNFNPNVSGISSGAQSMLGLNSSFSGDMFGGSSGGGGLMSSLNLAAMAPQAAFAMWPMAIQRGLTTKNKWEAFAWLGALGFITALFRKDNAIKKLKEAALSTYGITVKDKSVLNTLKQLGETMFGKGKVGENAVAVVSSDQGQNILRNYAEATGQSSKMIDRLYFGDENWSGNQFRGQFGGFRAYGGPVRAGMSYVVGERRPELFTPSQNGFISPTVGMGDQQMKVIMGQVEELLHQMVTKMTSFSPGQVVAMGAQENPEAIGGAVVEQVLTHPGLTDAIQRGSGRAV